MGVGAPSSEGARGRRSRLLRHSGRVAPPTPTQPSPLEGEGFRVRGRPYPAGRRARRAWTIVPSSSQSSSPPTGTPRANEVSSTPVSFSRSAR